MILPVTESDMYTDPSGPITIPVGLARADPGLAGESVPVKPPTTSSEDIMTCFILLRLRCQIVLALHLGLFSQNVCMPFWLLHAPAAYVAYIPLV